MTVTVSQESFLSNQSNKTRFIEHLTAVLKRDKFEVRQAVDDADLLIVTTALEQSFKTPVIIAEDVDVLVLLIALAPSSKKCYFLKPSRGKVVLKMYSSYSFNEYPFCKTNFYSFTQRLVAILHLHLWEKEKEVASEPWKRSQKPNT